MKDPLSHLYEKYGFDNKNIKEIIAGDIYFAVVLSNGQIGLAAALGRKLNKEKTNISTPDFSKIEHRIILTAYYNALLNYQNQYNKEIDIFDELTFDHYKKIVMIGLCRPLHKKMFSTTGKTTRC